MAASAARADEHVQNHEENTPLVGGVTGKGFLPGNNANPGGRPKGIARYVRELAGADGKTLIDLLHTAAVDGRIRETTADGEKRSATVATSERIAAARILMERGWGKPPAYAPIEDDDPLDLAQRDIDELAAGFDLQLDELARKRESRAA